MGHDGRSVHLGALGYGGKAGSTMPRWWASCSGAPGRVCAGLGWVGPCVQVGPVSGWWGMLGAGPRGTGPTWMLVQGLGQAWGCSTGAGGRPGALFANMAGQAHTLPLESASQSAKVHSSGQQRHYDWSVGSGNSGLSSGAESFGGLGSLGQGCSLTRDPVAPPKMVMFSTQGERHARCAQPQ